MRTEIEQRLDMHAVDIYGLSEVMGPGVANECVETKDGLHVWEDHFYPEVVDPLTDEVLPDGEKGELVFTSLTKQAMPVIRYRTRDLTRLLPGTARSMRRMEKVTGRTDDMMIVRGVNVFPTQVEEILLRLPALSPHFQCVLTRTGRMDDLTVAVERRADASPRRRRARRPRARRAREGARGRVDRRRGARARDDRAVARQDAADRRREDEGMSVARWARPPPARSRGRVVVAVLALVLMLPIGLLLPDQRPRRARAVALPAVGAVPGARACSRSG